MVVRKWSLTLSWRISRRRATPGRAVAISTSNERGIRSIWCTSCCIEPCACIELCLSRDCRGRAARANGVAVDFRGSGLRVAVDFCFHARRGERGRCDVRRVTTIRGSLVGVCCLLAALAQHPHEDANQGETERDANCAAYNEADGCTGARG